MNTTLTVVNVHLQDAKLFLDEEHIARVQERIYEFVRSVGSEASKKIVVLLN